MTAKHKLFKEMAAALWGPQYRSEAARQLGVHLRTLMRWDAGERPIPDERIMVMVALLNERQRRIDKLLAQFVNERPGCPTPYHCRKRPACADGCEMAS